MKKYQLYPFQLYLRQPVIIFSLIGALTTNILIWLWLLVQFPPTAADETVFLHYNILFGVDLLGPWWRLLLLPVAGMTIIVINFLIGWLVYEYDRFISQVLLVSSAICQMFLFSAMYILIFLNV